MKQGALICILSVLSLVALSPGSTAAGASGPAPLADSIERKLPLLTRTLRKKWPGIAFAAISHNKKTVVFYDGKTIRLTDVQGRHPRKLALQLSWDFANAMITDIFFSFRSDDKRLAVLVTLVGGEPMGATSERLWTADVATGRVRHLTDWGYRIQGRGPQVGDRQIRGWSADGKSVIVSGTVYNGLEMPIDQKKTGTRTVLVKDEQSATPQVRR